MPRSPVLFVSHGAPTFALQPGPAGAHLAVLGKQVVPRPRAVLVISPHWMTPTVQVGAAARPSTIHDFSGFDAELYDLQYPVAGDPELAEVVQKALVKAGIPAQLDTQRGLDHGAWVPLMHLYPSADVPALQVSMPHDLDAEQAWALGRALAPLCDQGVLILGSGSLTHNLHDVRFARAAAQQQPAPELAYVSEFSAWVRKAVEQGSDAQLLRSLAEAPHAARAHPTTEHFLPLLVAAGAREPNQPGQWLEGGITYGALQMDAVLWSD